MIALHMEQDASVLEVDSPVLLPRVDFPLEKLNGQLDFVVEILSALDLSGHQRRRRFCSDMKALHLRQVLTTT